MCLVEKTVNLSFIQYLCNLVRRLWNEEVQDAKKKNRKPRLRNAFIKFLGFPFLFLSSLALLEVGDGQILL